MKKIIFLVIIIAISFLIGCGGGGGGSDTPKYSDVTVKVIIDGQPYTDKTVTLKKDGSSITYAEKTDETGTAFFPKTERGTYTVSCEGIAETKKLTANSETTEFTFTDKKAKITFMLYANSGEDLKSGLVKNLREIYSVGSSDKINIVVFYKSPDTGGIYRGLVKKDISGTITKGLELLPNADFGLENTLVSFADWAINNYPAEKYIIDFWNHGSGWFPAWDTKAVNFDDEYGDDSYLEVWEIDDALRGKGIDYICFDACLMQMAECLSILKNSFKVSLAAEYSTPAVGFSYDVLLDYLSNSASVEDAFVKFSKDMENNYYWRWAEATLTVTDLTKFDIYQQSVSDICNFMLEKNSVYHSKYYNVANRINRIEYNSITDLGYFLNTLGRSLSDSNFNSLKDSYYSACDEIFIYSSSKYSNQTGISVNIPVQSFYKRYFGNYGITEFAKQTGWDRVLEMIYKN